MSNNNIRLFGTNDTVLVNQALISNTTGTKNISNIAKH